jgi:hypothetical protein
LKTAHNSDVGVRFIGPAIGLDKSSPYDAGARLTPAAGNPRRRHGSENALIIRACELRARFNVIILYDL